LIPGEKRKEKESIGKLIGIKQKCLIVVGDEMSELSPALIEACSNLENAGPRFQFVGLANPSSIYDPHGILCTPKDGWDSVDVENSDGWNTEKGYCVRIDAEQTQNFIHRKVIYPFQPSYEKIMQAKEQWGERSRAFYRMYKAAWLADPSDITVFSEADLLQSGATRNYVRWLGDPTPVGGLDLGYSNGGDRTILVHGLCGLDTDNVPTLLLKGFLQFNDDTSKKDVPRNFQIAAQVRDACNKLHILPQNLALDCTGSAGAFYDILTNEWQPGALAVHFGGWPSSRLMGQPGNRKPASEVVANRATELWLTSREFIQNGQILGVFPQLGAELVNRKTVDKQRGGSVFLAIEDKKSLRKRTGRSCDIADAALVLVELCRERLRFKIVVKTEADPYASFPTRPRKAPSMTRDKWRRLASRCDVSGNSGKFLVDANANVLSLW
jgi:hypothetical protein